MGDALRKSGDVKPDLIAPDVAPSEPEIDVHTLEPVPSPAKALQVRLDQHFSLRNNKFTGRFITFLVLGTCSATWLSGVALYSTL